MARSVLTCHTENKCSHLFIINSKIDAFDYDEGAGSISNRRTAVKIDPSLGVSLVLASKILLVCI